MNDKWYTVSEAASLLSVSTETVRRRIRTGKIEGRKQGNQYVVKLTSVSDFVAQSVPQVTAMSMAQLENDVRLLEERNRMLEKRVRELEEKTKGSS
jgi:excisionase family DNA binding protein